MTIPITVQDVASCFGRPRKRLRKKTILEQVVLNLTEAQNDSEKADSENDYWYYVGLCDAYQDVAKIIAPIMPEAKQRLHDLLHQVYPED